MQRKLKLSLAAAAVAVFGTVAVARTALAHGPGGFGGPGDLGGRGFGGHGAGDERGAYLAEALGISVDALKAAQLKALEKGLADAVAAERLTQAQADLMLAGAKLRGAIDRQAILAEALGLSVADLEAARADGKSMRDLLTAAGLDAAALRDKIAAATDAAIAKAVADGVITQAEADALKAAKDGRGMGFGRHGGPRGGMRGGRGLDLPGGPGAPDVAAPAAPLSNSDV